MACRYLLLLLPVATLTIGPSKSPENKAKHGNREMKEDGYDQLVKDILENVPDHHAQLKMISNIIKQKDNQLQQKDNQLNAAKEQIVTLNNEKEHLAEDLRKITPFLAVRNKLEIMEAYYAPEINFLTKFKDIKQELKHHEKVCLRGVNDKVEMHIPDRIVLIGQEQTYGTTAPPREIVLENQVLPQDPGYIRVQTPPRVITLDQSYRDDYNRQDNLDTDDEFLEVHQPSGLVTPSRGPVPTSNHIAPLNNSLLDTPLPVNGTVRDEMTHLRSLMGKQNKRIVRLEYEIEERRKRDKILFMLTASYLILKTLIWWAKD